MVGRPSRRSGSGLEIIPKDRKWSGDPPGGAKLVGRTPLRSGNGRESYPEVQK